MKSSGPVQEKPQPGCVQMVACRDAQLAFKSGKEHFSLSDLETVCNKKESLILTFSTRLIQSQQVQD